MHPFIESYIGRNKALISRMQGLKNLYFPLFEQQLDKYNLPLEFKYLAIVESAMKQSMQCYLPKLNEAIKFSDFIKQEFNDQLFIAHCEETNREPLKTQIEPMQPITILIGPEGDFSVKEIELALLHNFIPVTLGKTRLRTETAAIVACHSIAYTNE